LLVVEGFFENGVFVPHTTFDVKGRQSATLTIAENKEKEQQERITAWRQFGEAILSSDEELEGEPERFRFRPFEEII